MSDSKVEKPTLDQVEGRVRWLEAAISNIQNRFAAVNPERYEKVMASVRESMDDFTNKLAQVQMDKIDQGRAVTQLTQQVQQLQQQVTAQSASLPNEVNGINGRIDRLESRTEKIENKLNEG